ncbi:MAG: alpha-L-arabinofuranosidase C-terminal domain-containing protein [Bacteroidales bacterium]|nr:alpha-L-arabinofuranosidase C-terminal domain-containing protein [Bacteroidales bacterium]
MKFLFRILPLIVFCTANATAQKSVLPAECRIEVFADQPGATISKDIYGHFAEHLGHCIYEGIFVGKDSKIPNTNGIRTDVVKALRDMKIPNLRWPGGCFADTYHWKDGIGPASERPSIINTFWGGVTEDNSFGTHEFMELIDLLGCDPYITGNLGSGTVQEMAQWVEYLTSDNKSPMTDLRKKNGREKPWKVKYFAVGNENWGCGGNMTPEYYSNELRRYSNYLNNYPGNQLQRIACGPNSADYNWTETLMKNDGARWAMQGLALHYYTVPNSWDKKGSATTFTEKDWIRSFSATLKMDDLITRHSAIMDRYDPEKRIFLAVDEWGAWYDVEPGTNPGFLYQQNSLRDALLAAINLNIFNKHCDRVKLANLAQTVNVLQAVILTEKEKMVLTPTYYVFKMMAVHQEAKILPSNINCEKYKLETDSIPSVSYSVSRSANGKIHLTVANLFAGRGQKVSCNFNGLKINKISGEILTSNLITDCNTFEKPNVVTPKTFTDFKTNKDTIELEMPAKSFVVLEIE